MVLAASACLLGTQLLAVGLAPTLPAYVAGWVVVSVGMGCGLYDPAFSTLAVICGVAILNLTLVMALLPLALRKPLGRVGRNQGPISSDT